MENHLFSLNSMDGDFYQAFDSKGDLLGLNQKNGGAMNTPTYSVQPQELDSLTKLYLGGLTIVGLFVLFKCLD